MKTMHRLMNVLLVGLLLASYPIKAQSVATDSTDSRPKASSFEVGTYMGANLTINLMVAIHQPEGATIMVKDAADTVLYQQYLKKSRIVYHQKVKFEGCKPGVYRVEISDGRQTIIRRVEVVDMPAVEAQRYITYSSQTGL